MKSACAPRRAKKQTGNSGEETNRLRHISSGHRMSRLLLHADAPGRLVETISVQFRVTNRLEEQATPTNVAVSDFAQDHWKKLPGKFPATFQ